MATRMQDRAHSAESEDEEAFVYIFDRRKGDAPEQKIPTGGLFNFENFHSKLAEHFDLDEGENYVITTTNREPIFDDDTWDLVDNGETLYLLRAVDQDLPAQAQERVNYLPHYDTIVKGGMYEYYASEGQNPLPYAFAELIDNALAATANNVGSRQIEIRLHFDDVTPSKSVVLVVDNGKGMSSRQLNNWAIYRLSKFIRKDQRGKLVPGEEIEPSSVDTPQVPRSLNSDISYFGVGGKQAIFFIGSSTRMITKPRESKDVHELTISKEEFERKEKNKEAIYSGYIRNRKPGDVSHIPAEEETIRQLIEEELGKTSFTAVAIQGINPQHIPYLKGNLTQWTRQLAHIYHYYIHGPNGNQKHGDSKTRAPSPFMNIDIQVKVYTKGNSVPKQIDLRDIEDDMQTLFIRTAASTFEFKASVEGMGRVEGVMRYHPFLYERETYPPDVNMTFFEADIEDEHDYAIDIRPARGKRPIFECYWNGRLIPYTTVEEFEWCSAPKKSKQIYVPTECYNRVSGVLFTNDQFQVSTNKLTFLDLEMKLRDKNTAFSRISGTQEKRTQIEKDFFAWLKECHEQCDKQVRFSGFKGVVTRLDLPKNKQYPWSEFTEIEWDGKLFQVGQLVKVVKTVPIVYGAVNRFLLHGEYDGEVYATGGDVEIVQEPRSLYDEVKIFPLVKLDRTAWSALITKYIEDEEAKLPSELLVSWPEGDEVKDGDKRPAGKTLGDIKVEIANKRGELISKLPGSSAKRLLMELKIVWHAPTGDELIVSHISQYGKSWGYWFKKMENIRNLGAHTLVLQTVLNESGNKMFAGRELPSHTIKFTVTEAPPAKFSVGFLDGPFRIGVPFQIPLEFQDEFNNPTKPGKELVPTLEASGLDLSFEGSHVRGNALVIKGVVAKGAVASSQGKSFSLKVTIPGLEEDSHTMKIRLLPGSPASLGVSPSEDITVENGQPVAFDVQVLDCSGNVTMQPKLTAICKFVGPTNTPSYSVVCSSTGQGTLTGGPIHIKDIKGQMVITAKIELQHMKEIKAVERKISVLPSSKAAKMVLTYVDADEKTVEIKNGSEVIGVAGEYIKDLAFTLMDEAGKQLKVDGILAGKIKVNWTPKLSKDIVQSGHFPDIKIPNSVHDSKYCHINITGDSDLEFSFTVKGITGEPAQIKCKCSDGHIGKVRLGEVMESHILVRLQDKYGNDIQKLYHGILRDLSVTAEGLLVEETVRALGQNCSFDIEGIKFRDVGLGPKEVCVRWKELVDYVRVEVTAGKPTQMTLRDWKTDQTVSVFNDCKLPKPLVLQLCDEAGNPSSEADVRVQLYKDPGIKLTPVPQPIKTDSHGVASFGVMTVTGKQGVYEIQPKAFQGRLTIAGPKIKISISADSSKPVAIAVDYDKSAMYTAGGTLPEFKVCIQAEDGSLLAGAKPANIALKMWKSEGKMEDRPPVKAQSSVPDARKKSDAPGTFLFSKRKVPELIGTYHIMFVYKDSSWELLSNLIVICVKAGPPSKLVPLEDTGTYTVSNTQKLTSRCLIRSLHMELRDNYNNPSGLEVEGKVYIEVTCNSKVSEIPKLAGKASRVEVSMVGGKATIQNLYIHENTAGQDGQEYLLRCTVSSPTLQHSLPAYNIPFLFYNDAIKQSQMAALTKERDGLRVAIRTYKSLFDTTKQLIDELKIAVHESNKEKNRLKEELKRQNIPASQVQTVESVDSLVQQRMRHRDLLLNTSRRVCSLQPAPRHPEVLGRIAHLAQIRDHEVARVMSWHMSSDMDCIVTHTLKKAKEIYRDTDGRQQVLSIDTMYRKNLPDWNKALPHVRFKPTWKPPGNPKYAREFLEFPNDPESCKTVFGSLLGETIVCDSLETATAYRQELVKYTYCPTILSRDGERIRSNGKFGGSLNKAPAIEKMRGAVFGEPLPIAYHAVCTQLETLQNFRAALQKYEETLSELEEHEGHLKDPEMQMKYKECREAEEQMKVIEQKLGIGQMNLGKRPVPQGGTAGSRSATQSNHSPSPAKRPRAALSGSNSSPVVNGNGMVSLVSTSSSNPDCHHSSVTSVLSPTRQSARLAATGSASPLTNLHLNKRIKKS